MNFLRIVFLALLYLLLPLHGSIVLYIDPDAGEYWWEGSFTASYLSDGSGSLRIGTNSWVGGEQFGQNRLYVDTTEPRDFNRDSYAGRITENAGRGSVNTELGRFSSFGEPSTEMITVTGNGVRAVYNTGDFLPSQAERFDGRDLYFQVGSTNVGDPVGSIQLIPEPSALMLTLFAFVLLTLGFRRAR